MAIIAFLVLSYQPAIAISSKTSNRTKFFTRNSSYLKQYETEIYAIAKTLAGECYDDKKLDKRHVCEVILNRVSNINFANTVLEVLTTPGAFNGYWRQSRPISENDYAVAEQALRDWYENGCKPLSKWLFFSKGTNRENVFRSNF